MIVYIGRPSTPHLVTHRYVGQRVQTRFDFKDGFGSVVFQIESLLAALAFELYFKVVSTFQALRYLRPKHRNIKPRALSSLCKTYSSSAVNPPSFVLTVRSNAFSAGSISCDKGVLLYSFMRAQPLRSCLHGGIFNSRCKRSFMSAIEISNGLKSSSNFFVYKSLHTVQRFLGIMKKKKSRLNFI